MAAAAAAVDAATAVLQGKGQRAIALVRPPGHHAEAEAGLAPARRAEDGPEDAEHVGPEDGEDGAERAGVDADVEQRLGLV